MAANRTITIDARFHGPPRSGNGGYVCGVLANEHDAPCEVRLRLPPPLGKPLDVERHADGRTLLLDGGAVVAEARDSTFALDVPLALTPAAARAAAERFSGFKAHIFPTCFVCGPERSDGDGLRIFPGDPHPASDGESADTHPVAAPWVPHRSLAAGDGVVATEFIWAALDCPGAFTQEYREEGRATVLGSLECEIVADVRAGGEYVVSGWPLGGEGRKSYAGTAVHDGDGKLCAVGKATWIWIDV